MADRSVVVRLRAEIGQYQAAMRKAQTSATEFGREVTGQGKASRANIEAVGHGALIASGAMALGFGKMISVAAGFEKQMSGVQAVSGASAAEMDKLSKAAIDAGASTDLAGVSASEAAQAEAELVKAGVSVSDVLGGALMGSLTLASAGQLDFADAATIAAQAMNIFDMAGSDVTHIADVLAAAANKSAADVGQMGDALRQGGLVAAQTGLTFEETSGALAAFADNALVGSDAGTSLKTMLQRLTPQSTEAANLMKELGFSAYDAYGNFIGLEGLAGTLQSSLKDMTVEQRNSAMATLFGSDAVRAANILYEQGAEGIHEYVTAVNDQGAAARMAAIQNDNLSGDIEALGGALESAFIENGSKATDTLRFLTQGVTSLVTGFSAMPPAVQGVAVGLGAVTTVGVGVVGVIGTLGPKVKFAADSLKNMGTVGKFVGNNMGTLATGLGAAGIAVAGISLVFAENAKKAAEAEARVKGWADAINEAGDVAHGAQARLRQLVEENADFADMIDQSGISLADWGTALSGTDEDFDALIGRLREAEAGGADFGMSVDFMELTLQDARGELQQGAEDAETLGRVLTDTGEEAEGASGGVDTLTESVDHTAEAAKEAETNFKALQDAYRGSVDPLFAMLDALDGNREAQADLNELLKSGTATTAEIDAAYRAAASSALDVEGASRDLAFAVQQGNVDLKTAKLMLLEWVDQGLITEKQAGKVAAQFDLAAKTANEFSGDYVATATANTDQAMGKFRGLRDLIAEVANAASTVELRYATVRSTLKTLERSSGGVVPAYLASGGFPGGPRGTDTIPAWLTPGEYVMNKAATDRLGVGLLDALNAGRPVGSMPASGGGSYTFAPSISVVASPGADGRQVGQQIVDALSAWTRDNGPLPARLTAA